MPIYNCYTVGSIALGEPCIPCLPQGQPIAQVSRLIRKEYLDDFYNTQLVPFRLFFKGYGSGGTLKFPTGSLGDCHGLSFLADEDLSKIQRVQITPAFDLSDYNGIYQEDPARLDWALDFAQGRMMVQKDPETLKAALLRVNVEKKRADDTRHALSRHGYIRLGKEIREPIAEKIQDVLDCIRHQGGQLP